MRPRAMASVPDSAHLGLRSLGEGFDRAVPILESDLDVTAAAGVLDTGRRQLPESAHDEGSPRRNERCFALGRKPARGLRHQDLRPERIIAGRSAPLTTRQEPPAVVGERTVEDREVRTGVSPFLEPLPNRLPL